MIPKFRAWDPDMHTIFYQDNFHCFHVLGDGAWTCIDILKNAVVAGCGTGKLMQYTGLLDCHGKEIWEGDIAKTDTFVGEIRWIKGSFCVWHEDLPPDWCKEYVPCYMGMDGYEIIGNIYENPGLLQEGGCQ